MNVSFLRSRDIGHHIWDVPPRCFSRSLCTSLLTESNWPTTLAFSVCFAGARRQFLFRRAVSSRLINLCLRSQPHPRALLMPSELPATSSLARPTSVTRRTLVHPLIPFVQSHCTMHPQSAHCG